MREYLESNPILWVKSGVLLAFLTRRMVELKNLQSMLSKIHPPNYKTLTCLIMHLIQHVPTNPSPKLGFLQDALVDIQFGPIIERFGLFFLHNLNLETGAVEELDTIDSQEAHNAIKSRNSKDASLHITNSCPTAIYPLGNAPWSQVVETMALNPELLVEEWIWNDFWGSHYVAGKLFIEFTVDMWLTVNPHVLKTDPPHPETLEDATRTWTLCSLKQTFTQCIFCPSNYNLSGPIHGRHTKGLCEMLSIFFPLAGDGEHPSDSVLISVWEPFKRHGYLSDYYQSLAGGGDKERLHNALLLIFNGLQCLPMSLAASGKSPGRIWDCHRGSVRFMTNPAYYRLECIGGPSHVSRRKAVKVKANKATIEARLAEEHSGIPAKRTGQQQREQRRAKRRAAKQVPAVQNVKKIPCALNIDGSSPPPCQSEHSPEECNAGSLHYPVTQRQASRVPSQRVQGGKLEVQK